MFALPTLRKLTDLNYPSKCVTPPCGPAVAFSSPIAQMRGNHYTVGVATNWVDLIGWGAASYKAPTLGFSGNTNTPKIATINRALDNVINKKENSKIIKVRSYGYYTYILTAKGYLYASGKNISGVFNTGTIDEVSDSFNMVANNVLDFDTAGVSRYGDNAYTLIIRTDGKLYGIGGDYKAYGLGSTQSSYDTLQYLNIDNVVKVVCTNPDNQGKSFVIKSDGTVWACGYNTDGCLGVNSNDTIIYNWQKVQKSETIGGTISDLTNVIDVITTNWTDTGGANTSAQSWSGGNGSDWMSSYFLTSDGAVYTCGNNKFGQLGLGQATSFTSNVAVRTSIVNAKQIAVAAGGSSIAVATNTNQVWTWGNNQWGQLGLGNTTNNTTPTRATLTFTDNVMEINGGGSYGIINGAFVILTGSGEVHSAGFNETYALGITTGGVANAGPITTFTKNEYFGPNPTQLQDPTQPDIRLIAKAVDLCGYGTEMAQKVIINDGTLYMSGYNQALDIGGIIYNNFNPNIGENVLIPSKYIL